MDHPFRLRRLDTAQRDRADARDVNQSIAINRALDIDIHRTPTADQDLVARAQGVVGRHRRIGQRHIAVGSLGEEGSAIQRQCLARAFKHELLEVIGRQRLDALLTAQNGLVATMALLIPPPIVTAVAINLRIGDGGVHAANAGA